MTLVASKDCLPLTNLPEGWDINVIYRIEHPPGYSCVGENDTFLYLDAENRVIIKLNEQGKTSVYVSCGNLTFSAIAYQPNRNRLLGIMNHSIYALISEEFISLKTFSSNTSLTPIVVNPSDDSFFCGDLNINSEIKHYDADGNYIQTIASGVHSCNQMDLSNNQSLLLFSESYAGRVSVLNLTSFSIKVLISGIALPGTYEGIAVGVDDNDNFYYMAADGNGIGFYKYINSSFVNLMPSKGGIGEMEWSPKHLSFLVSTGFGACIIGYDPLKTQPERLTPSINSRSIIETKNEEIIIGLEKELYYVTKDGPSSFSDELPYPCSMLILDQNNSIYAALSNDSVTIVKINSDGSFSNWFVNEIDEFFNCFFYDLENNDIILLSNDFLLNETNVWRIPITDPYNFTRIISLNNTTKTSATIDNSGNIYVYEAYNNTLYKIPNLSSDLETITTDFVDFSDIYGGDVMMISNIAFCVEANGILILRNDDFQIWSLDENIRLTFGKNSCGIDNSGIYQTFNNEIICTQSSSLFKLVYIKPKVGLDAYIYLLIALLTVLIVIVPILIIRSRKKRRNR